MELARKEKIILIISLALIVVSLAQYIIFVQIESKVTEVKSERTVNAMAEVGTPAGVLVDNVNLNFGRVPPGRHSIKEITVANTFDDDVFVRVDSQGSISPYLSANPSDFFLVPGESATIRMFFMADNLTEGNFTGLVRIRLYENYKSES